MLVSLRRRSAISASTCFALVQFLRRGLMGKLGQFDAVIFAQAAFERGAFVANFAGGQVLGVQFFFEFVDFRAVALGDLGDVRCVRCGIVRAAAEVRRLGR